MATINVPDTLSAFIPSVKQEYTLDLTKCHEEGIRHLILYGLREYLGNAGTMGGKDVPAEERAANVAERFRKILDGSCRDAGGRSALDPVTVELRAMIADALGKLGMKVTEAREIARDVEKGMARVVAAMFAAQGKHSDAQDADRVAEVAARNLQKWEAKAKATVAARKNAVAIDLD